jgi:2-hydroxycyclohexanecarboxyl-CoA dehydrogenase
MSAPTGQRVAGGVELPRDSVTATHRLPDVIVNAAGFVRVEPFMNSDDDLWTSLVAVNYLGPVQLSHAFLTPIVAAERTAKIVNIASDTAESEALDETVYSGTKGGLIAFTKPLAREMAHHRINVGPKDWDRTA